MSLPQHWQSSISGRTAIMGERAHSKAGARTKTYGSARLDASTMGARCDDGGAHVLHDNGRVKHDGSSAFFFANRRRLALQIAIRPRRDDVLHEASDAVASRALCRGCTSNGIDIVRFTQGPGDLLGVAAKARMHDAALLAECDVGQKLLEAAAERSEARFTSRSLKLCAQAL